MDRREQLDALPWRHVTVDETVQRLMAERGETDADILWITEGPKRAADFWHDIMRTKRHVYTIVKDDWLDDGAYICKVFVAKVEDGHGT